MLVACQESILDDKEAVDTTQIAAQADVNPAGVPASELETVQLGPLVNNPPVSMRSTDWLLGDVFAGIGNGSYNVFQNDGTFKETIVDGLGGFTTGAAFNPGLDKLYTTNFTNTKIVVYNDADPHTIAQVIDAAVNSPGGHTESIVFAANGEFYAGHPDGNGDIHKYDATGTFLQSYDVATENRGSDWIDLAADQATMFYTSEGGRIMRYDVVNDVQLADFADIGGTNYALRILPPGDGSGGLIVANTTDIKRLDGSGAVVQTYDAPGENAWFAMNLDPNGTSFWGGDFVTNNFYRFNISTGTIELGPVSSLPVGNLFGLAVKGEITSSLALEVAFDIKPTSCPNPLNVVGGGVLPAAILGTEDFDVSEIDPTTIELEGVPVSRYDYEDVTTPIPDDAEECDCTTEEGDGYMDLTLKFNKSDIVSAIGPVMDGDVITLTVSGNLLDGREFDGTDCVIMIVKNL